MMVVRDAREDRRVRTNPLVTGEPHVRFYAGVPLVTGDGFALGTLCVVDFEPREITDEQADTLRALARQVIVQLELRRSTRALERQITQRERAEEALRESEARFAAFMDNAPMVAFLKDGVGRMLYVNRTFERLSGVTRAGIVGKTDADWLSEGVARQNVENDRTILASGRSLEVVETVPLSGGVERHWLTLKFPLDAAGVERLEGGVAVDITECGEAEAKLAEANAKLREADLLLDRLAHRDGLTGVYNRRAFQARLEEEVAQAGRRGGPVSLMLRDVDHFKAYNDAFGHPAGDAVLKRVARVLGTVLREVDFVARFGGEEFTVVMPETDVAGARAAGEHLRAVVQHIRWECRGVTVSVGAATLRPATDGAKALVAEADEALYRSTGRGRNRVTHAADPARGGAAPRETSTPGP
jgi:diguanylate cyclase (GGDEF)-like protein/PAS domain S-box-containing protein